MSLKFEKDVPLLKARDLLAFAVFLVACGKAFFRFLKWLDRNNLLGHYLMLLAVIEVIGFSMSRSWCTCLVLGGAYSIIFVLAAFCLKRVVKAFIRKDESFYWTLSGWDFERECATILSYAGYKDVRVTKGSGDLGVDLIFYKDGEKYIGQCKHYRTPVAPEPVRALWGVKDDFRADKVVMIASSGVTKMAKDFIDGKPDYLLWTLDDIILMNLKFEESEDLHKVLDNIKSRSTEIKENRRIKQ